MADAARAGAITRARVPLSVRLAQILLFLVSLQMTVGGAYFGFFAGEPQPEAAIFGTIFIVLGVAGIVAAAALSSAKTWRAMLAYAVVAGIVALGVVKFVVYQETMNVVHIVAALIVLALLRLPAARRSLE